MAGTSTLRYVNIISLLVFIHHNFVETRKKLKRTNKPDQTVTVHQTYSRNKNELFMSKNFTQKVVRSTIFCFISLCRRP